MFQLETRRVSSEHNRNEREKRKNTNISTEIQSLNFTRLINLKIPTISMLRSFCLLDCSNDERRHRHTDAKKTRGKKTSLRVYLVTMRVQFNIVKDKKHSFSDIKRCQFPLKRVIATSRIFIICLFQSIAITTSAEQRQRQKQNKKKSECERLRRASLNELALKSI